MCIFFRSSLYLHQLTTIDNTYLPLYSIFSDTLNGGNISVKNTLKLRKSTKIM